MIVVDATVLVYAVGADHSLRDPCRDLIAGVAAGEISATTTVEVIQEFAHVRARRRPRADAAKLAKSYAELFAPLIAPEEVDLLAGLERLRRSDRLGAFDCVLVETAKRRSVDAIASADRAFNEVRGIRLLDPAAKNFHKGIRER